MISPAVLEQPGRWRIAGIALGLLALLAPALPLLGSVVAAPLTGSSDASGLGAGFAAAVGRSLLVAAATAALSLVVGLPAGLLAGLYDFPGRRAVLAAVAIPLFVPSFLWAIGLSSFRITLGLPRHGWLAGARGSVLAFSALGVPLVVFVALLAARGLTRSQVEAVRLAGGERALLRYAGRSALPAAGLVALLAGVLTLSDPGPGQILGFPGIATQVLISFSALYDFPLAARQCLALSGIVLVLGAPIAWRAAPRLAAGHLGRDVDPAPLARSGLGLLAGAVLAGVVVLTAILPLAGLAEPLLRAFPVARALREVERTAANTLVYALGAGFVGTLLGAFLAVCAGRERRLRTLLAAGLLVLFALPPSLGALGVIQAASAAPPWLDPLLRSRLTVAFVQGLRFAPIAALLALRSVGMASPTWAAAAAVHGVPLRRYLVQVLLRALAPAMALSILLVALLAAADVGTVLLLQPPGEASLPVAIFTVMANAPESLVASLCLLYVTGAATIVGLGWTAGARGAAFGRRSVR